MPESDYVCRCAPASFPSQSIGLGTQRPYACAYAQNNCTWAISWVPFRSEARNEAERAPAARARHRATWRHTLSSRARVMGIHVFHLAMDTRFQSLFLASLILLVGSPAAGAIVSERVQKFISSHLQQNKVSVLFIGDTLLLITRLTGQSYATLYLVPTPTFEESDVDEKDFHSPLILLWNPNITHHALVKERLQHCITCGQPYVMAFWNDMDQLHIGTQGISFF